MDLKTVISQVHWNSLQSNFTHCKMLLTPPSHKHFKKNNNYKEINVQNIVEYAFKKALPVTRLNFIGFDQNIKQTLTINYV